MTSLFHSLVPFSYFLFPPSLPPSLPLILPPPTHSPAPSLLPFLPLSHLTILHECVCRYFEISAAIAFLCVSKMQILGLPLRECIIQLTSSMAHFVLVSVLIDGWVSVGKVTGHVWGMAAIHMGLLTACVVASKRQERLLVDGRKSRDGARHEADELSNWSQNNKRAVVDENTFGTPHARKNISGKRQGGSHDGQLFTPNGTQPLNPEKDERTPPTSWRNL